MATSDNVRSGDAASVGQERRRFKRYPIQQNSMLCNERSLAEIFDISSGGLACRNFIGVQDTSDTLNDVEIINCEIGLSVQGLKCRLVRTKNLTDTPAGKNNQEADCFLEFVGLNDVQSSALGTFIENTSRGPGPGLVFSKD